MRMHRHNFVVCLAALLTLFWAYESLAAEIRLRESTLQKYRNQITAIVNAKISNIGERAHPIDKDCDLHVPLRVVEVRVPVIGELKNACSIRPDGSTLAYWSERISQLYGNRTIEVEGAIRIWLEHPPTDDYQSEAFEVPEYESSNPDHMFEIHPITRVGSTYFLNHVKDIVLGNKQYKGYSNSRLQKALEGQRITISKEKEDGENYITIHGNKVGFNHWRLSGIVSQSSRIAAGGEKFVIRVMHNNRAVNRSLSVFTIAGTEASRSVKGKSLESGDRVTVFGLVRLNIDEIMRQATNEEKEIKMPYELVALSIERE